MAADQKFIITALGSSSAVPMHGRHLSSVIVSVGKTQVLIDCGEATQFQLSKSNYKPSRLETILISHLHGDHWYGLPGLLASLSLAGRTKAITIVGPSALQSVLRNIPGLKSDELSYPIQFVSVENDTDQLDTKSFTISWLELEHAVFCVGFRITENDPSGNLNVAKANALGISDFDDYRKLKEGISVENKLGQVVAPSDVVTPGPKGRVFGYVTDTRPCENGVRLGMNADLLLHEATFLEDLRDRAEATGHSTAKEAATIAKRAAAQRLLLTHFSARYDNADDLVNEAQSVFPNTSAVDELEPIEIGFREDEV